MAGSLGLFARGVGITDEGTLGLFGRGFVDNYVAPAAAAYTGKYRPEWAGALADVAGATGFSSEHAGALRDLTDAGR